MLTALHVQMGKMMQDATNTTLEDRVIELHDIARQVEQEVGTGALSKDLRAVADRLNEMLAKEASEWIE